MTMWIDRPGTVTPVELGKAYRLINHGPTLLVGSAHGGQLNVMAAAWNMPVDFAPPKVAVVIDAKTLTRTLIQASGEFTLCVPTRAQLAAVVAVGQASGRDVDKWALSGLKAFAGQRVTAPLIAGCVAWLECRCLPEPEVARRHDLILAEVVAAWADGRVFADGRWLPLTPDQRMLHHIAGGAFFETGDPVSSAATI